MHCGMLSQAVMPSLTYQSEVRTLTILSHYSQGFSTIEDIINDDHQKLQ